MFFISLSLDSEMIPALLFFITVGLSLVTLSRPKKEWFDPALPSLTVSAPILFQNSAGLLFDQTYQSLRVGTSAISFYNSGSEIVRLSAGGVGIGTTNAEHHKLFVNGGISLGNDLINGQRYIGLTSSSTLSSFQGLTFTSSINNSLISIYTASTERMRVDAFGNVNVASMNSPIWNDYYGQVNPPLQTLTIGGAVVATRPIYIKGSSFVLYNGSGSVVTSPNSTPPPITLSPVTSSPTSFNQNQVYYLQPSVLSQNIWTPIFTAGALTIPYQGLYQFQVSLGFPYTEQMTVFISKNIGNGSEPSLVKATSQMLAMKQVVGTETTVSATAFLSPTDLVYLGVILNQSYLQLSGNKCTITATVLKQTA
jgi:hypothetical protein